MIAHLRYYSVSLQMAQHVLLGDYSSMVNAGGYVQQLTLHITGSNSWQAQAMLSWSFANDQDGKSGKSPHDNTRNSSSWTGFVMHPPIAQTA